MARHRAGNFKQRNKPFKGSSRKKGVEKDSGKIGATKKIQKWDKPLNRADRVNKKRQQLKQDKKTDLIQMVTTNLLNDPNQKNKLIEFVNSQPQPPKIILLAPFNQAANVSIINDNFGKLFAEKDEGFMLNNSMQDDNGKFSHHFKFQHITTSNKISPELKNENYIFLTCPRNMDIFLDYAKVADIIGVVLSCKDLEQSSFVLDPFEHAKAFDEFGYKMLSCLRAQGIPTVLGIIQDIEHIAQGKQNMVKKLYQRFFESEFTAEDKFVSLNNTDSKTYMNMMRTIQTIPMKTLAWRENRSYMLTEKIQVNPNSGILEVIGYLKGSWLNPNQLVHITGYGDFALSQIDLLHNPNMPAHKRKVFQEQNPQSEIFMSFAADAALRDVNKLASGAVNESGVNKIVEKNKEKGGDMEMIEESKEEQKIGDNKPNEEDDEIDWTKEWNKATIKEGKIWDETGDMGEIEDEAGDDNGDDYEDITDSNNENAEQMQEEKNRLRKELTKREEEDLQFEDEANYQANISLKERFKKYRGLKSFRTSDWGAYNGLTKEFEKIIILDDFNKSRKVALEEARDNAVVAKGCYVRLYVMNFPLNLLQSHDKEKPFLVSSLLKYEQKISLVHMKIKRTPVPEIEVNSKEEVEIQVGFRILKTKPIYSKIFGNCQKLKYTKKTIQDQVYMMSTYGEITFTPANVMIFKTMVNGAKEMIGNGELQRSEPLKITLKRIILCGYPFKINKRKSVVRMMFFNPKDVNYFSNIELHTKLGLRGHIKQSLGTHGNMKCYFNSIIKAHDIVCMNLYKRVFPPWSYGF